MKKLSILIALFLVATIGGVYATWSYAGTNDIADAFAEAKVTIADVELLGANGVYKVESNLVLIVDQKNTEHHAELLFQSNNNEEIFLKVTFTAAVNAPQDIKDNGVKSELYFGTSAEMKYDGKDIFWFSNTGNGTLDNEFTWTKEGNGVFTYTLDVDDLKAMIKLNDENGTVPFVLDTKAKHDDFRENGLKGNIVIRVTDGTVN